MITIAATATILGRRPTSAAVRTSATSKANPKPSPGSREPVAAINSPMLRQKNASISPAWA
ncbi:MAG: hypothetical protein IPL43_07325 [Micropruina sp.]|nr:hypothetical protein [Micropruina sp.]